MKEGGTVGFGGNQTGKIIGSGTIGNSSISINNVWLVDGLKPLVPNNRLLEFTFLSCFKPLVPNNGLLEFTFLSCFKPPVLNNEPLEFTFHYLPIFTLCQVAGSPYEQLANTFNFLKNKVSSPVCLVQRCHSL